MSERDPSVEDEEILERFPDAKRALTAEEVAADLPLSADEVRDRLLELEERELLDSQESGRQDTRWQLAPGVEGEFRDATTSLDEAAPAADEADSPEPADPTESDAETPSEAADEPAGAGDRSADSTAPPTESGERFPEGTTEPAAPAERSPDPVTTEEREDADPPDAPGAAERPLGERVRNAISALDFPGSTEEKERSRDAVRAAYAYLQRRGVASREEFERDLFPDRSAGYDDPEAGWWEETISRGLDTLPDVERDEETGGDGGDGESGGGAEKEQWRYVGGGDDPTR